jgi:hypothetical protein
MAGHSSEEDAGSFDRGESVRLIKAPNPPRFGIQEPIIARYNEQATCRTSQPLGRLNVDLTSGRHVGRVPTLVVSNTIDSDDGQFPTDFGVVLATNLDFSFLHDVSPYLKYTP